jgi:hypothetical protein
VSRDTISPTPGPARRARPSCARAVARHRERRQHQAEATAGPARRRSEQQQAPTSSCTRRPREALSAARSRTPAAVRPPARAQFVTLAHAISSGMRRRPASAPGWLASPEVASVPAGACRAMASFVVDC